MKVENENEHMRHGSSHNHLALIDVFLLLMFI